MRAGDLAAIDLVVLAVGSGEHRFHGLRPERVPRIAGVLIDGDDAVQLAVVPDITPQAIVVVADIRKAFTPFGPIAAVVKRRVMEGEIFVRDADRPVDRWNLQLRFVAAFVPGTVTTVITINGVALAVQHQFAAGLHRLRDVIVVVAAGRRHDRLEVQAQMGVARVVVERDIELLHRLDHLHAHAIRVSTVGDVSGHRHRQPVVGIGATNGVGIQSLPDQDAAVAGLHYRVMPVIDDAVDAVLGDVETEHAGLIPFVMRVPWHGLQLLLSGPHFRKEFVAALGCIVPKTDCVLLAHNFLRYRILSSKSYKRCKVILCELRPKVSEMYKPLAMPAL